MMNDSELIEEIRLAQVLGSWGRLEELGAELADRMRPDLVTPLLVALVDNVDDEEVVFGLVHLAETVDGAQYTQGVIAALPQMVSAAPRWAKIVVSRILNSSECFPILCDQVVTISEVERAAVIAVCSSIRDWAPDRFLPQLSEIDMRLGL